MHAAYSIFHAEIVKIMWIVYIYTVFKSINIFMRPNAGFSKMLHENFNWKQWRTEGGFNPPPQIPKPSKIVPNSPGLWKLLKNC